MEHIDELRQSGIVGLLFGAGNVGSTLNAGGPNQTTAANPASMCTTDGSSGPPICNDHVSTSTDGDGGYLRMAAQRYYASGPLAVGRQGTTPSQPVAPPQAVAPPAVAGPPKPAPAVNLGASSASPSATGRGQSVTLKQTLTSNATGLFLVDFELHDSQDHKVWQSWHDADGLTAGQPVTSSVEYLVALPPGRYTFKLGVFTPGWGSLRVWNNDAGTLTVS